MNRLIGALLVLFFCSGFAYAADFEYNGMWFELTSAGSNPTCALTMPPNGYKFPKRFVIPSTVKYRGVDVAVTRIRERAFAGAKNIRTIIVPPTVRILYKNSFAKDRTQSPYGSFDFEFSIKCDSIIFEDGTEPIEFWGGGEDRNGNYPDASYMYLGRNIETKYRLHNNQDEGTGGAFHFMFSLENLVIGETVTYIPKKAFERLKELRSVTFGSNIKLIGDYAFSECKHLKDIRLPKNLALLGFNVFDCCEGLTSITFEENIKKVEFNFNSCDNLVEIICHAPTPPELWRLDPSVCFNATLFVPAGSVQLYREAEGWKDFLTIKEFNP